jgi:predicted hotdog family 3-hydroxylacyl-ACP dehydratase
MTSPEVVPDSLIDVSESPYESPDQSPDQSPNVWPDIRTLVPHAAPMLLLDRVLAASEESLAAEVVIRAGSIFCGEDGVGGWVGVEYMAQAIAAHAGYLALRRAEPVRIGFLLGTRRYDCRRPVFHVASVLRVEVVRLLISDNGLGSYACRIDDEQGEVATATVSVFLPADAEEFLKVGEQ